MPVGLAFRGMMAAAGGGPVVGQVLYSADATWICPDGVTSVSVVCIGPGSGYAGAGALSYKNNITVVPGNNYTVNVDARDTSGSSWFSSTSVVKAGIGSTRTGDGGGNGGLYHGGGAGGYSGNGGQGRDTLDGTTGTGNPGTGGGGGAGGYAQYGRGLGGTSQMVGGGGGTGPYGEGASGAGGVGTVTSTGGFEYDVAPGGRPGSTPSGAGGQAYVTLRESDWTIVGAGPGNGGYYGGSAGSSQGTAPASVSYAGCVRIIWPGDDRQFPSTRTTNE